VSVLLGEAPASTGTTNNTAAAGVGAAVCAEGALAVDGVPGQAHGPVSAPVLLVDLVAAHGVERVPPLGTRVDRGPEVDDKGEHIEGKNQGDDPLEHSGDVVVAVEVHDAEDDHQAELEDDEDELDPEGYPQVAVLAVLLAEALVLCANEDCREPIAANEADEEDVMELLVVVRVEPGQAAESHRADDGEDYA